MCIRRAMLFDHPLALMICLGAVLCAFTAKAQEPLGGPVGQQPGAIRERKAIEQQPEAIQELERPAATMTQPRPQCAAQPQCGQESVAVCTESGVCQRGDNRPEQACLNYACVAKLQPLSPELLPKQPLAVTPKLQPGIVGAP